MIVKPVFVYCAQNKVDPATITNLEDNGFVTVLIEATTSRKVAILPLVLWPRVK